MTLSTERKVEWHYKPVITRDLSSYVANKESFMGVPMTVSTPLNELEVYKYCNSKLRNQFKFRESIHGFHGQCAKGCCACTSPPPLLHRSRPNHPHSHHPPQSPRVRYTAIAYEICIYTK